MSAVIVTFTHEGRSYNVWVWPNEPDMETPPAEVNVDVDGSWVPISLSAGTTTVEVQA